MNPIDLKPTSTTPAITLKNKSLSIQGRSIPLSEAKFYDPFINWAKELKSDLLTVEIKLEYMNSSSSKKLLQLLKAIDSNKDLGNIKIKWYYEEGDEELKEHGLLFERLLKNSEFRIIKYKD